MGILLFRFDCPGSSGIRVFSPLEKGDAGERVGRSFGKARLPAPTRGPVRHVWVLDSYKG
jgi:hypothetical protein